MNILREGIFISEIVFQSNLAQRGAERLEAAVENFDKIGIWSSIQLILNSSGNVSKILWPKMKYKDRGEKLRKLLSVDNKNILHNRKFRNQLEHYDDLIDELFNDKPRASYIDLEMNPSMSAFGSQFCNRGYNTFNNTLVIRGQILDLNAVMKSIEELKEKCRPYTIVE